MSHQPFTCFWLRMGCAAALVCSGCGQTTPTNNSTPDSGPGVTAPAEAIHNHPTIGPHQGDLVELGNEDYHAEMVHGEGGEVTIYMLDSSATTLVPIDATEVAINLSLNGQAQQFKLSAAPEASDPAGKSSCFTLKSPELTASLDAPGVAAKLVLHIGGRSFTGKIDHSHAGGHAHTHGADDALVWGTKSKLGDVTIKVGHHGTQLRAGTEIEPAVSLLRGNQAVADAEVFNALLADDGQTVLATEQPTVYEPATTEAPAHYAQGGLTVPADVTSGIIRFRVVLADGQSTTVDLPVKFVAAKTSALAPVHSQELADIETEAVGGISFERDLYLTDGGIYTDDDIAANGNTVPSVKFKGMHWAHDDMMPGDKVCPVTSNKAEAKCAWIVNGQTDEFCCNPCIDKFVKWAKTSPDKIKSPDEYVFHEPK